jgi:HK97 family phage major capsid protein
VANVVQVDAVSIRRAGRPQRGRLGLGDRDRRADRDRTPTIERVSIRLHELSAMPKASQRLLDDAAFDVETWLAGKIATRFIRAEATAFVSGDGVNKPKGILTHAKAPNGTGPMCRSAPCRRARRPTSPRPTRPALIDLVYALGAQYRANGAFVMNSKTAAAVRKMKDADGRFMWATAWRWASRAAAGLSGAGLRGHARHRAEHLLDRVR